MKQFFSPMYIDALCPICHHVHSIEVELFDYLDWTNGKLAQDAFPYLDAHQREMLISGVCPSCWGKMYGCAED